MNPWQLAKESESSQQIALFCWAAKAEKYGFEVADWEPSYKGQSFTAHRKYEIPELAWLHHIPNGGSRGDTEKSRMIVGGQLKAEGVKAGVMDVFWPLARYDSHSSGRPIFCGLYIEMKRPSLKTAKGGGLSDDQIKFGNFADSQGYHVVVCYTWLEAAAEIKKYYLQS
jgi:hypothetical protein